ncbi:hypothetical protein [Zavarzinella formosa]|uniref:hypothetical protein n=1 Tax=Zavarzinella formosa TaxID=360055 RepID=UPI000A016702|nr:hypothetical protein [Zavarzinella formosa]
MKTVIRRCVTCPTIRGHARNLAAFLWSGMGIRVDVEDGGFGEFTVLANGVSIIAREGDFLPWPEEVESALQHADVPDT